MAARSCQPPTLTTAEATCAHPQARAIAQAAFGAIDEQPDHELAARACVLDVPRVA